jgi:CRISPR-associated Csx14 family protein
MPEVLIATLGTESQVVTLSLLELERLGYAVEEVAIIHTAGQNPKIIEALNRLHQAFTEDNRLQKYRRRFELLQGRQGPIVDITTAAEAEDAFNEIFLVVRRYKLDGYRVHLNIAGGRKPMSIYGMVTAQILFDEADRLWHLVSNDSLVKSRRLWPEEDDEYQLVPVPVIRASDRPDLLRQFQNAEEAVQEQEALRQELKYALFLEKLTEAERRVARLLAQGLSNEAIALELTNAPSTISKHLSTIYGKWQDVFGPISRKDIRGAIMVGLQAYFLRKGGEI